MSLVGAHLDAPATPVSGSDSQGRRMGGSARFSWEDTPSEEHAQEEQHHGTIVALPMRAMDPESGLLFNQQEYQRYLSI